MHIYKLKVSLKVFCALMLVTATNSSFVRANHISGDEIEELGRFVGAMAYAICKGVNDDYSTKRVFAVMEMTIRNQGWLRFKPLLINPIINTAVLKSAQAYKINCMGYDLGSKHYQAAVDSLTAVEKAVLEHKIIIKSDQQIAE